MIRGVSVMLAMASTALASGPIPEGGMVLADMADFAKDGAFYGGTSAGQQVAERSLVADDDRAGGARAIRIAVRHPDGKFWSSAMYAQARQPVRAGDRVLVRFRMRAVKPVDETGSAACQVFAQGPGPEYRKSLTMEVRAGPQWQEFLLPFASLGDYPTGEMSFQFGFGNATGPQVLDLADIEILHYGTRIPLADLPRTRIDYDGRAPDAPWRAEAAARIERHRKGDFTVTVRDAAGRPVPGADVRVRMRRHAYKFGSVVTAARIMDQDSVDARIYREKILELFNATGPENDLKWPPWEADWGDHFNRAQTLAAFTWLKEQGLYLRGHVLVWPHSRNLPKRLQPLVAARDPSVPQLVLDHIADIVPATAHLLDEWDVVNEPYDNHELMDIYGRAIMADWFRAARRHHPAAALYINDYGILSAGGRDLAHQRHYEETIRFLLDQGAPLDGIGMQGHFDASPTGIPRVLAVLDHFAAAFPGQAIKVTEFDVDTDDEQLQGEYTRDFMTALFSHPRTVGFQMWGFWAGAHWRPRAAMFARDWREKPMAQAYRDLVLRQWWTDLVGTTGPDGTFSGRGFLGDHQACVDGADPVPFAIAPGRVNVEVRLGR